MIKRTNLHDQENLYRPLLEIKSIFILLIASSYMVYTSYRVDGWNIAGIIYLATTMLIALVVVRCVQVKPYLIAHLRVFYRVMLFVSLEDLREINKAHLFTDEKRYREAKARAAAKGKVLPERRSYFCEGYVWGNEHSERVYQLHNLSSNKQEIKPSFVFNPIMRHFKKLAFEMKGSTSIFAVDERCSVLSNEDNWFGHTFITGNVGSGKTVLLRNLSSGMLHMGHVILVIDPKNDKDWKASLQKECIDLGKPFYHIHPSKPSTSDSFDVCHNYTRDNELASRIVGVLGDFADDPFIRFAEGLVLTIVTGSKLAGEKPNIKSIYRHIQTQGALVRLTVMAFEGHYKKIYASQPKGWESIVKADPNLNSTDKYKLYKEHYINLILDNYDSPESHRNDVLSELMDLAETEREHFNRMTASFIPLFKQLTGSPLDELMSPTSSATNSRKIVNTEGMFNSGGVLYISLDGLSDPSTAKTICQLIMSDVAAGAANRYNNCDDLDSAPRISIYIDEGHSAINAPLINLLAQGRAAKVACFICTQTIADIVSETNEETASRVTGLCNNYISLRVNDVATQDLVLHNFGEADVSTNRVMFNTGTSTKSSHSDFTGGIVESKQTTTKSSIPKDLIGQMPNLHLVARLADGRRVVGQVPIPVPLNVIPKPTTALQLLIGRTAKVTFTRNINLRKVSLDLKRAA